jgi:hypothetical protein
MNLGLTLFHTGIVVDDLEASMAALTALDGVRWAPPQFAETPMEGPDGFVPRRVRFTYSLDGPHHLELLQQVDTTLYDSLTGGRRVHHLGYLTDDLEADSRRLEAAGMRRELRGITPDAETTRATYHHSDLFPGMWIELVDQQTWASISAVLAEARAAQDGIS